MLRVINPRHIQAILEGIEEAGAHGMQVEDRMIAVVGPHDTLSAIAARFVEIALARVPRKDWISITRALRARWREEFGHPLIKRDGKPVIPARKARRLPPCALSDPPHLHCKHRLIWKKDLEDNTDGKK